MNFEVQVPTFLNRDFSILDFGAKSDVRFNNQKAIQKAIDVCHEQGGGRVIIPNGYYLTGPIELKSNVNLYVDSAAFVQFSKSKEEYPLVWTEYEGIRRIRAISPISAKNATNIAITGKGILDGNGFWWRGIKKWKLTEKEWQYCLSLSPYVLSSKETEIWCPTKTYYEGVLAKEPAYDDPQALEKASLYYDVYRPVFVSLVHCDRILIEGVTLQNSPAWNVHPLFCTNFTLKNASIKNKFSAQNGDGLDLESCQNCEIVGTTFEVGDDGICLKSGKNAEARKTKVPTKNVWIHDCKVFNAHGGFVVGSEMSRGISDVLVEDCTFSGTDVGVRFKSALGRGGVVENILIRNIQMSQIKEEAFIFTMGYVLSNIEDNKENSQTKIDPEDLPEFKDITMENILCSSAKIGIKIVGLPQLPIHDLSFKHVTIVSQESMSMEYAEHITLNQVKIYAGNQMFEWK